MKLSVKILCRDADATIRQCLSSVKDIAQEIICVLDTRSKDSTGSICLEHTPDVYQFDWLNDSFADARNFALSKCSGDGILVIDADEVFEGKLPDLDRATEDYFFVNVIKDGVTIQDIRLYRNIPGIKYRFARHNELVFPNDYLIDGACDITLRGITVTTPEQLIAKSASLLNRHLKQIDEEPDNEGIYYHIAQCYKALNDWPNARKYARIAYNRRINDGHKALLCILLYEGYLRINKPFTAMQWLNLSLIHCPNQITAKALMYEQIRAEGTAEFQDMFITAINTTGKSDLPIDITKEFFNNLYTN